MSPTVCYTNAMTGTAFLWIIFIVVFLMYVGYGCVLMYHWFKFGFDQKIATTASFLYIGAGSLALALFAGALV
jgi:Kef-type K+ transport system membrane component KefB